MRQIPVLLVIKGLGAGGAERLLVDGLAHADRGRFSYEVAYVLGHKDALVPAVRSLGIPVHALDGARDPRWVVRLRRLLRRRRPLVMHSHLPVTGIGARVASSPARGVRHVYTEHNEWSSYRGPTRVANAATFWRNDYVFAVSERVRRSIRYPTMLGTLPLPPVETLYHGIVLPQEIPPCSIRSELGLAPDAPLVVTVANLRREKGHETLLRSAVEVRRRFPEVRFVLVGIGPLEERIRHLVSSLGLEGTVHLVGYRTDAVGIAAAADLFVLPSDHEGLSIALLEAMAAGVACVATDAGGATELLRHEREGLVVPPRSPATLAEAIDRLIGDPSLRARLGASAAIRAMSFDIRKSIGRMEELYEQLAA